LKRLNVISTEVSPGDAKWRNLLKTDFSTRPAEGGLDPVQGFALPARSK
jgi:hypothetical protein